MNRDDIIRMALESGGVIYEVDYCFEIQNLERFAYLVAASEREACADLCESIDVEYDGEGVLATWCASAIRSRGN